jgi:hypothetical protein
MPYTQNTEGTWEYTYDPADPVNPFGVPINQFDQWSAYLDPSGVLQLPEDPTPWAGKADTPAGMEYTRGFEPSTGQYQTRYQWPSRNVFGMSDLGVLGLFGSLFLGGGTALGLATAPAAAALAGGASAAAAGAPAVAAAAPSLLGMPLSTLGTIGTYSGLGSLGANLVGSATNQPWLQTLGKALGIAGGLAGGAAGLGSLASTGVTNLSQAARLASSLGKVGGAIGSASGAAPLKNVAGYLSLAGSLGKLGGSAADWFSSLTGGGGDGGGGEGLEAPGAGDAAPPTQGGRMAWDDWLNWDTSSGMGLASPNLYSGDWTQPLAADTLMTDTGWGDWGGGLGSLEDQVRVAIASRPDLYGTSVSGNTLSGLPSSLASLVPAALRAGLAGAGGGGGGGLGSLASLLGPGLSALGSLGTGLLGANAAGNASAAQAAALNRGIDLQTAQWLQQQQNLAPWLAAGQQALGHMTGRMGWGGPQAPGATPAISGANYALPSATPGWSPSTYGGYTPTDVPNAGGYAYTPGQGPRAQDYRYTPGGIPTASQFRYTPGAVPTLSGAELLANDPGVQFRLDRARNALEGSAAARGSALSGPALLALQEQGQDLASQEYGNAWQRAAQQAQMREQWAQQAGAQNFGQAMSEAQLREQVNQIASQQGWSQAQAEAAFREQLAQQSSAQNWGQAAQQAQLLAQQQQFGWQAGFQGQQAGQRERQAYDTDLYNRLLQQSQIGYGRDVSQNQTDYERQQQAYAQQVAELTRQWNQFASLAGTGQVATGQLGTQGQAASTQLGSLLAQLGPAQGLGDVGSALSWQKALGGVTNNLTSVLAGLNR